MTLNWSDNSILDFEGEEHNAFGKLHKETIDGANKDNGRAVSKSDYFEDV